MNEIWLIGRLVKVPAQSKRIKRGDLIGILKI